MATTNPKINRADRIRALKLYLHRRLDGLYAQLCDPQFTGTMIIELSGKEGQPGEPKVSIQEYGILEP